MSEQLRAGFKHGDTEGTEIHRERLAAEQLRLAVLVKPVQGRVVKWRRGVEVRARKSADGSYVCERVKSVGKGNLPLLNVMCCVPRSALRFVKGGVL
jgi:hypothetical protein